jgi:ABC-2 type transport system permease protein
MGGTVKAIEDIQKNIFDRELLSALSYLKTNPPPFSVDIHAVYNPLLESTYTVVPSLIGVILMISLSLITAMTIIEEKEAGNLEVILNSHIKPLEIMIGKFITYLLIGYIQLIAVLYVTGDLLFNVPMRGSVITFLIVSFPFLMGNLMLGLAASTVSASQLQASQLVSFFFLPSLLLSGFLFPFYGMPYWAQVVGNMLPLTHYMRISSGIMLKDFGWLDIFPELWPIVVFALIVTLLAMLSFKRTLD